MSSAYPGYSTEAEFDSMALKLRYQKTDISVQLNKEFMKSKVIDVKKQLLAFHPDLQSVSDPPEQLGMYAVFSGDEIEQEPTVELSDETVMVDFKDVLSKCQYILLERKNLAMK